MVDLHSHTDRSDGVLSPRDLVSLAVEKGLKALAITDHDSLAGYDAAAPFAGKQGLDLICGVELNTRFHGRPIHILGYFLDQPPGAEFRAHLDCIQKSRRERNQRLSQRLHSLGAGVRLEEAEALGRGQTGRPHFAMVMVRKGYVASIREAFERYLDESAPGYVERKDPSLENVLRWIRLAGGVSSWAHPARFIQKDRESAAELFAELAAKGLDAIEVYHTDHSPEETQEFLDQATEQGLAVTGGSDFHGLSSTRGVLGSLELPLSLLEELREFHREQQEKLAG